MLLRTHITCEMKVIMLSISAAWSRTNLTVGNIKNQFNKCETKVSAVDNGPARRNHVEFEDHCHKLAVDRLSEILLMTLADDSQVYHARSIHLC